MIKIYVLFLNVGGSVIWPYVEFDEEARRDYLLKKLKKEISDTEFIGGDIIRDFEEVIDIEDREDIDAILVYVLSMSMTPQMPWYLRDTDLSPFKRHPMIIATDFLGGFPYILDFCNVADKENLPVVPVTSSNFEDVRSALHLLKTIYKMKGAKILSVEASETGEEKHGSTHRWKMELDQNLKTLKEVYGIELLTITGTELNRLYSQVDKNAVEELTNEWIEGASRMVGPNREDIIVGSRICLALEKAVKDARAQALIVDFVPVLRGELLAMPCLAVPYLRRKGIVVSGEGDFNSCVISLIMYYLTGRMGFINDPVIDTSLEQEWCCHCDPVFRWKGKDGPLAPYELRFACHHAAAVPVTEIPINEPFTSVALNVLEKKLAIHQGISSRAVIKEEFYPKEIREKGIMETLLVRLMEKLPIQIDNAFQTIIMETEKEERHPGRNKGEINIEERACASRYVFDVENAKKIYENMKNYWHIFGWHRTMVCGDYREQLFDLAKLLGLEIIEEDN